VVTAMDVQVNSPEGETLWKESDSNEGTFAITTETAGRYETCFIQMPKRGVSSSNFNEKCTVFLSLRIGAEANDYDQIAIDEKLSPLEVELRKLYDLVTQINYRMTYMRGREATMRNTNGLSLFLDLLIS